MNLKAQIPFLLRMKLADLKRRCFSGSWLGRWSRAGLRAYVARSVRANQWERVTIGNDAQIHHGTQLHSNFPATDSEIVVGSRCFIGQNCFFSAGDLIELQQDCLVGASCFFLGAGHQYDDPTRAYAKALVVSYGKIVLQPNVWLGTNVTLIGDIHLGFGTVVSAGSLIRKSIPPLCLVAGNPARILKVFSWKQQVWMPLPEAGPALDSALVQHQSTLPTLQEFLQHLKPHHSLVNS